MKKVVKKVAAKKSVTKNEKETRNKRGQHPNSRANLKTFTKENQPENNGRPKGSQDRATVYERFLYLQTQVDDPANKEKKLEVTLYQAGALAQIKKAMDGDTKAWVEIQDTLCGKLPTPHEIGNKEGETFDMTVRVIEPGDE